MSTKPWSRDARLREFEERIARIDQPAIDRLLARVAALETTQAAMVDTLGNTVNALGELVGKVQALHASLDSAQGAIDLIPALGSRLTAIEALAASHAAKLASLPVFGTMATQNSNAVSITGGTVAANLRTTRAAPTGTNTPAGQLGALAAGSLGLYTHDGTRWQRTNLLPNL